MKRYWGLRYATLALCQWEVFAILKDDERYPTLSRLAGQHRWIAPALVIALVVHLWWPVEQRPGEYADETVGP